MNKIVTILLLGFSFLYGLEFHTYQEALKLQKRSGKVIMIDAMRKDCHYCIKMEREVFDDPQMSKWLESRFIPVKIDIDEEALPFDKKVSFTPTFFFIKNGKILKVIPGSWNIQDFKELTKDIK